VTLLNNDVDIIECENINSSNY